MQEGYEDAKYCRRYDKKRDCYVNRNGDPVVHRKEVVFNDVLAKVAEEVKVEAVKEEDVKIDKEEKVEEKVVEKEAVIEEQKVGQEEMMKKEEEEEVKNESLNDVGIDAGDKKKSEADQKQMEANTEVPITKVLTKKTVYQEECRSSLAREEEAADP
ncbi:neurofilament medium polypeptide-like [Helianthus annuus]|uniref:neurofilament medium polypeptide-like n=1 Tax=Helianthus annuus TaxID=4232 RepID=UPI00165317FE|nr:neurofilament medium polypeptide-like [Helianthus annuus]